jgi:hypothetical protein
LEICRGKCSNQYETNVPTQGKKELSWDALREVNLATILSLVQQP